MGFPSLVYSHGWTVALWIAGYMVVPLTGFGVLGKRMAQLSRRTGAITVPDLFRERFNSPRTGAVALAFILLFMVFMMVAQFKAGAIIMKLAWPGAFQMAEDAGAGALDRYYYIGLVIFTLTVVGYTLIGGFLAAVWTDLFQSVMMFVGVVILLCLVVPMAGGMEHATRAAVDVTGPGYVFGPGYAPDGRQFMPVGLAFSFFFVWVFAGMGSPAGMVRIMASSNTQTIRRSIFLLSSYNAFIYLPLVVICVCGRALIHELPPGKSDEIVPRLALLSTQSMPGGSYVAGLILTAPFGAVMASGLVRDLYQRFIRPDANPTEIKRLTYIVMVVVGGIAFAANLKPVAYLQAIVVFSGTGAAATFVIPALMTAYWRRATSAGVIAAMLAGAGTMIGLYATGFLLDDPMIGQQTKFRPFFLLGLDPIVWGMLASLVTGLAVTLLTRPPDAALVSRLFDEQPNAALPAAVPGK
jgi:sodium/pantothenate symporter